VLAQFSSWYSPQAAAARHVRQDLLKAPRRFAAPAFRRGLCGKFEASLTRAQTRTRRCVSVRDASRRRWIGFAQARPASDYPVAFRIVRAAVQRLRRDSCAAPMTMQFCKTHTTWREWRFREWRRIHGEATHNRSKISHDNEPRS